MIRLPERRNSWQSEQRLISKYRVPRNASSLQTGFFLFLVSQCSDRGIDPFKVANGTASCFKTFSIRRPERLNNVGHYRVQAIRLIKKVSWAIRGERFVNMQNTLCAGSLRNRRSTTWLFCVLAKITETSEVQMFSYWLKRQKHLSLSPLSVCLYSFPYPTLISFPRSSSKLSDETFGFVIAKCYIRIIPKLCPLPFSILSLGPDCTSF